MKISPEILEKAKSIIEYKESVDLCLKAGICPKCGHTMSSYFWDDGETIYICKNDNCNSKFSRWKM